MVRNPDREDFKRNWEQFWELSENIFLAIGVSLLVLIPLGAIPSVWITLVSIMMSYVLSDVILNIFIHGGGGYAKTFTQNEFAHKGHAYLVFFVGVVVGTLVSMYFLNTVLGQAQSTPDIGTWTEIVVFGSLIVAGSVAFDVQWRFYQRRKHAQS